MIHMTTEMAESLLRSLKKRAFYIAQSSRPKEEETAEIHSFTNSAMVHAKKKAFTVLVASLRLSMKSRLY